ncbi:MAG: IclR family transcriptional regulator [Paracoccaceae bacterium]
MNGKADPYLVPGLVRGLNVLQLFTPDQPNLRLGDIAQALGVTRSAAFRSIYTLAEMGCLQHDEHDQSYSIGSGVLPLAYGYVGAREIAEIVLPELEALRTQLDWSAHMGVLRGTSVLYALCARAGPNVGSTIQVGRRLPARSTAMGRVLLANLPQPQLIEMYRENCHDAARGKGMGLTDLLKQADSDRKKRAIIHVGDFEARIVSAAVPLRDFTGRVVAAINVVRSNEPDATEAIHGDVKDHLIAAGQKISLLLGYDPTPR